MRRVILGTAILGFLLTTIVVNNISARAEPGGCLKYGAGGAAAGHFVGQGHAVLGAAGGCAAGMYRRHESRKQDQLKNEQPQQQPVPQQYNNR